MESNEAKKVGWRESQKKGRTESKSAISTSFLSCLLRKKFPADLKYWFFIEF